jgi:hypothetical protein
MRVYQGSCLITVTGVEADWPQRVVVRIRNGAEVILRGAVGEQYHVDAPVWELLLQHQYDGVWRENVRAVTSRWTQVGSAEQQVVRSKDRDWAHDRNERNLVLRLERGGTEAVRQPVAQAPSAARAVTTQSAAQPAGQPTVQRTRTSTAAPRIDASPSTSGARATSSGGGSAPVRTSTSSEGAGW